MADTPQRQAWQRQPGEKQRPYAAFCVYRDLGPDRNLTKAVRVWLTEPCDKSATKRRRQQRRYQTHEKPGGYLHSVRQHWGRHSVRWGWVARVRAYDEWMDTTRQQEADRLATDAAIREAEENEKERASRVSEARRLAHTAEGGLITAAPVALARLQAAQAEVKALLQGGASNERITAAITDAVAVLNWASKSLDLAHKMEREALGRAGTTIEIKFPPEMIDQLTQIIMAHISEDDWEMVGDELAAVLRGDRVNGNPR